MHTKTFKMPREYSFKILPYRANTLMDDLLEHAYLPEGPLRKDALPEIALGETRKILRRYELLETPSS